MIKVGAPECDLWKISSNKGLVLLHEALAKDKIDDFQQNYVRVWRDIRYIRQSHSICYDNMVKQHKAVMWSCEQH
jgi:hypothetical protein